MSLDALPDDFRDLLVELADAGAEFVLIFCSDDGGLVRTFLVVPPAAE